MAPPSAGGGGGAGGPGIVDVSLDPQCNGANGHWNDTISACSCNGLYYGEFCQNMHCPDWDPAADTPMDCTGHGMCVKGKCLCAAGWGQKVGALGANVCEDAVCPIDCGKHGMCKGNVCVCQEGWQGPACREPKCAGDCNGHGQCTFLSANGPGECVCDYGFKAPDCKGLALYQMLFKCPNECHGNGLCMNGKCVCQQGYSGIDCSTVICPEGTSGPNCEFRACPRDCSGYGMCFNGECACDEGHQGSDCSIPMQCYEACAAICLPDLTGERCEFCKGQCLTLAHSAVVGKHSPMISRFGTLQVSQRLNRSSKMPLALLAQRSGRTADKVTKDKGKEHAGESLHLSMNATHPSRHFRTNRRALRHRRHKEVSAVQTVTHRHVEVSSVKIGRY